MAPKPKVQSGKKVGNLLAQKTFSVVPIHQGATSLYSFSEKASDLWSYVSINRREEDKDDGYQRVLANSRVRAVADYIKSGNIIPGSVIIALDKGSYDPATSELSMDAGKDIAWVIDGQHRLAGAHMAALEGTDIELNVIAMIGLSPEAQIEQFVTINREGKNVPTSLYLDLLKHLPKFKTTGEVAAERATDIANALRKNPESTFFGRIVVTTSPRPGQVSIVNFVRKLTPYVNVDKGLLNIFTLAQQEEIIENYFDAIRQVFPDEWKKADSIFFKTVGFGALMNVFEDIFKVCTMQVGAFRVTDIVDVLKPLRNFDFAQWSSKGSGNKAEIESAKDFQVDFLRETEKRRADGAKKQIRLR
ncbi:DGQHR domain-containing protein [Methylobacterium sp. Leaf117]|uniref:DGQHR domain-containing protein n=1 Tax=Methylobacterium sp. Leaf117 TaxID=1736260 RepID=UPI0009E6F4CA|nr:DGQHR domain-containing protein [Methylobacterium sp. Leaf117]